MVQIASKAEEAQDGEDKLPVLPDVPTTGPSEPGQPDAKKLKLDDESAKKLCQTLARGVKTSWGLRAVATVLPKVRLRKRS